MNEEDQSTHRSHRDQSVSLSKVSLEVVKSVRPNKQIDLNHQSDPHLKEVLDQVSQRKRDECKRVELGRNYFESLTLSKVRKPKQK